MVRCRRLEPQQHRCDISLGQQAWKAASNDDGSSTTGVAR